jgi:hypothetical protein
MGCFEFLYAIPDGIDTPIFNVVSSALPILFLGLFLLRSSEENKLKQRAGGLFAMHNTASSNTSTTVSSTSDDEVENYLVERMSLLEDGIESAAEQGWGLEEQYSSCLEFFGMRGAILPQYHSIGTVNKLLPISDTSIFMR